MRFVHNFPKGIADSMFKKCSQNHKHQTVIGSSPGHGSRAIISQAYAKVLCEEVARVLRRAIRSQEQENDTGLRLVSETDSDAYQQKYMKSHGDDLRPTSKDIRSLERD